MKRKVLNYRIDEDDEMDWYDTPGVVFIDLDD